MFKQNYLEVYIGQQGDVVIKTSDYDDDCLIIEQRDIEPLIEGLKICLEKLESE